MQMKIEVERLTIVSPKPFQAVAAGVDDGIGHLDMVEFQKVTAGA